MLRPLQWIASRLGLETTQATVPVMDGALKPNTALDDAKVLLAMPGLANVLHFHGVVIFSSGDKAYCWDGAAESQQLPELPGVGAICSLAINSQGLLAVGRDGDGVYLGELDAAKPSFQRVEGAGSTSRLGCVTALLFSSDDKLLIANGSEAHTATHWKADLVAGGSTGQVLEYSLKGKRRRVLADGLSYPNGLAVDAKGDVLVSEAWRHRVVRLTASGTAKPECVISDLPAYPAGMAMDRQGVLRLALFAPRSQLFEFILGEKPYLKRMVEETPQSNWVCPTLRSGIGYREPLQGGAVRQMGVHKAWAPTLSYGLVVEFDANFLATRSWHSRADGRAHGTTAVSCVGDKWMVAATGDGKLLELPPV